MTRHEPGEEYAGPATITPAGAPAPGDGVPVEVDLRGVFQPLDGRFHWYGRVAVTDALSVDSGATVTLTTDHGSAEARLSDRDPWGRLRVTGTGRPPF